MSITQDWSDLSLMSLFRLEVETQAAVISDHLLALESSGQIDAIGLDTLMRAAHSIKGAARIVQIELAVEIAHVLEDFFEAAKQGTPQIQSGCVEGLLAANDFMLRLSTLEEADLAGPSSALKQETAAIVFAVKALMKGTTPEVSCHSPQNLSATSYTVEARKDPDNCSKENVSKIENSRSANSQTENSRIDNSQTNNSQTDNSQVENSQTSTPQTSAPQISTPQISNPSIAAQKQLDSLAANPSSAKQSDAKQSDVKQSYPLGKAAHTQTVRVNAENLNRLMGLAGESVVESNWLPPFATSLLQIKQQQQTVISQLEGLSLDALNQNDKQQIGGTIAQMQRCQQLLNKRLDDLDRFSQRFSQISDQLYREMIASHMCAFELGTKGYSRLVRDLAKTFNKQVSLEIEGLSTRVDRALLEKLDAPIVHLITNAIAHGIESPQARQAVGKLKKGTVRISAIHHAGSLRIVVEDDGRGFDFIKLRQKVASKGMSSADVVAQLSEAELIEFLFLPGFSTYGEVDQYSGRGYGLDIARNMVQAVGGRLLASSIPGEGTRFEFQLPLTLSVVRSLIFEVAGEPYALNLAHISRVLKLSPDQIFYSENRPYCSLAALSLESNTRSDHVSSTRQLEQTASKPDKTSQTFENISLVSASQLLSVSAAEPKRSSSDRTDLWVIVLGELDNRYGLCVESVRGEKDLVIRPLDPRLGKVPNISSAALSEKGEPILILDVADILCSAASLTERLSSITGLGSINNDLEISDFEEVGLKPNQTRSVERKSTILKAEGNNKSLFPVGKQFVGKQFIDKSSSQNGSAQKKILVVDDSMTVRAMEKKLLQNRGYSVDLAVDGADGWNALQMKSYDLVITDIDMPRMTGITLIEKIRQQTSTQKLPVIVVSYKDREADQLAGLQAGANYYLTKSSFHDDGLINAVTDLIGSSASPNSGG